MQEPAERGSTVRVITIPETFSLLSEPDAAIEAISQLAAAIRDGSTKRIWINQTGCKHIGHAAETVMSALALMARRRGLHFNGFYPAAKDQTDIVQATGIPRALGISARDAAHMKDFTALSLFEGRKTKRIGRPSTAKELILTQSTEYLEGCLNKYGVGFTADGEDLFTSLLGEILGNAEDHSEEHAWWIAGYLHEPSGQGYGNCYITVFNFGQTIFESLQKLPARARLRREIEALVLRHRSRGLFQRKKWTTESLWTLYALQGGVSRFNAGTVDLGHRGTGTVRMIEFFLELGRSPSAPEPPLMSVISGGTQLLFDGKYRMCEQVITGGMTRPVIAFNAANDLELPPDRAYVRRLNQAFPGTLVTLRFYLDRKHLQTMGGSNVHN